MGKHEAACWHLQCGCCWAYCRGHSVSRGPGSPYPSLARLIPCCTRWKGGRRGFGFLKLLLLYGSGQRSQVELFLPRKAFCR